MKRDFKTLADSIRQIVLDVEKGKISKQEAHEAKSYLIDEMARDLRKLAAGLPDEAENK